MSGPWLKYQQAPAAEEPAGPWTRYAATAAPEAAPDPTEGNSFAQNALIGIGSVADKALDGVKGLFGAGRTPQEREELARLDGPLNRTAGGKVGNVLGALAVGAPSMLVPGGGTVAGAAAAQGALAALTTPGDAGERATAALGGAAGGAGGVLLGRGLGWTADKLLGRATKNAAAAEVANAGRDAAVAGAREAGYVLTPSQAGKGGPVNAVVEALGGKIKTQQAASLRNQQVTNDLARRALGVAPDTPLSPDVIKTVRADAGKAYEALRSTGTIKADQAYTDALDAITQRYGQAAKAFPGLARPEIDNLVGSLKQAEFDAGAAVDALKILRESADDAFRAGNSGLARANREAATALEGVVERNLKAGGDPQLLQQFRQARTQLAKAHSVMKAMNPSTGDVSAVKLAQQVRQGKPLSDELRQAADFGAAFPRSAQGGVDVPAYSVLDAGVGAYGLGQGNLLAPLVMALRAPARSLALTGPYQRAFVTAPAAYGPGMVTRAAAPALNSDIARRFLEVGGGALGAEMAR